MVQALVAGYPKPSPVPSPRVPAGQAKRCSCHHALGCGVQPGAVGGAPAVTGAVELPDRAGECIIDEAGRPAPLNAGRKEMSSAPR